MKNFIYTIALFLCIVLVGCDVDSNTNDSSLVPFKVSFVSNSNTEANAYRISFDGTEIKNGNGICKKNQSGILEVFNIKDNAIDLQKDIKIQGGENIRLIKLPNTKVDFFNEKDYVSFKVNISYLSGKENAYDTEFNGIPLVNGINYCKADKATGNLNVFLKGTKNELFSLKDITVSAQSGINLMQLSEKDFIQIPIDNETNPESERYTKVRFFYTIDALPNVDIVKLIIYAYPATSIDEFQQVATIDEIKVNEFSKYVTLDYDYYKESKDQQVGFCYDLINAKTGEKIIDYNVDTDTYLGTSPTFAKQTFRIESNGKIMNRKDDLSTPW